MSQLILVVWFFTLFLGHLARAQENTVKPPEGPIYFHKQILSRRDAIQFQKDIRATIARVVVVEMEGIPELYVVTQKYLLEEVLRDTGTKLINLIFTDVPSKGWQMFYKRAQGHEHRIYIEIPVARGIGVNRYVTLMTNYTEKPPKGFKVLIMAFAEFEIEAAKYSESMILDISKAFEHRVDLEQKWLRMNAYHIRNINNYFLDKKLFEGLKDRFIIYQNDSNYGVTREDVLDKMVGFDVDKIIWENVETEQTNGSLSGEATTDTSRGCGEGTGTTISVLLGVFTVLLFCLE